MVILGTLLCHMFLLYSFNKVDLVHCFDIYVIYKINGRYKPLCTIFFYFLLQPTDTQINIIKLYTTTVCVFILQSYMF